MKNTFLSAAIMATLLAACQSNGGKTPEQTVTSAATENKETPVPSRDAAAAPVVKTGMADGIVKPYLQLKDALAKDNGKDAAGAGKEIVAALANIDVKALTPAQKKTYDDVASDAKENAEHIGDNADKISHQREHFAMLSADVADLVTALGTSQKLYEDFCPMFNDKKGAIWISESKEIKNPYYGSKMPTCGSVKKEL